MFPLPIFILCVIQYAQSGTPWLPPITGSIDEKQYFWLANYHHLHKTFLAQFQEQLKHSQTKRAALDASNFHWTSVTMFREGGTLKSWLIAAGASPKQRSSQGGFTSDFGAVFGCQIEAVKSSASGFDLRHCELLGLDTGSEEFNHSDAGLLGRGLRSLRFPSGGGIVVFCDPLWHSSKVFWHPRGRCYLHRLVNSSWQSLDPIEFCEYLNQTEPCAGGFSIDLRLFDSGKHVQLLAGLPFSSRSPRVSIVDDIMQQANSRTQDIGSNDVGFGMSVAWSPHLPGRSDVLAIVGSPSSNVNGYRVNALVTGIGEAELTISQDSFGGLGTATESSFIHGHPVMLAGAPYEHVEGLGANVGRVLLQCHSRDGLRNFSLDGSRRGEMFGYAVSRIGDVDGDLVGDVAISAPSLGDTNATGRVYIHRLLPDCRLASKPLQVLEALENARGFGVSLSRGVDLDADGGPELAVTTLDPKIPVLLYSVPRRLRASCIFKKVSNAELVSVKQGVDVVFEITIYFIDILSKATFPASDSFRNQHYQVNPDVLWLKQYEYYSTNQSEGRSDSTPISLLEIMQTSKLDPARPRFQLQSISYKRTDSSGIVALSLIIKPQADGELLGLDILPLQLAVRSVHGDSPCSNFTEQCPKRSHPYIDWSECVWKMPPITYHCRTRKCEADLQISVDGESASAVTLQYGHRKDANQTLYFNLHNSGPTRSQGLRVEMRSLGWPKNATQPGLRAQIVRIQLQSNSQRLLLASSERRRTGWSIFISETGASAVITFRKNKNLYPDEGLVIAVDVIISGLFASSPDDKDGFEMGLPNPVLQVNVSSILNDPVRENNIARITFDVKYEPHLRISLAAEPPALIDKRKELPNLDGSTKNVLGRDLGLLVQHLFLVENLGTSDLHNIKFELDTPLSTVTGDTLLYLVDRARLNESVDFRWTDTLPKIISPNGSVVGTCQVEEEFVNSLNFTILETRSGRISPSSVRRRRSTPEGADANRFFGDYLANVYIKRSCERQTTISCGTSRLDFKVVCPKIVCHLSKLSHNDTARISLTAWLWAPTFFKYKLSDVKFVSRLRLVDWGDTPKVLRSYPSAAVRYPADSPAYDLSQAVVFLGVTGKCAARVPLWSVVCGAVVGSMFLFGFITSLYCLGFFRTRRMTNEARRRSLMANAARRRRRPLASVRGGKHSKVHSVDADVPQDFKKNLIEARNPSTPTTPKGSSEAGCRRNSDWILEYPCQAVDGSAESSGNEK